MENSPVTMMTINELASKTKLAKHFIRQLIYDKKIVYVTAGRKYLVNYEKFLDYLNTGNTYQPEPYGKIRRLG